MPATMTATAPLARIFSLLGVLACALFLGACAVGPDYVRPAMDLPVVYKEQGPWKIATPGRIDSRGRGGRLAEAGDAGSEPGAASLAAARLSIQAALAQNYLQLRVTDLQKDLYARTVADYTR